MNKGLITLFAALALAACTQQQGGTGTETGTSTGRMERGTTSTNAPGATQPGGGTSGTQTNQMGTPGAGGTTTPTGTNQGTSTTR